MVIEMAWQLISEFSFLVLGELLAALSFLVPEKKSTSRLNQFLAVPKYIVRGVVFGAIFAGITLLAVPEAIIENPYLHMVNMLITPIAGGYMMVVFSKPNAKDGPREMNFNSFSFGFVFGLTLAGIRHFYAT